MARFGQLPEVVKFIEFGKEHLAFPVASRNLEHHGGVNDEPLLTLVIVKPVVADECLRCHFAARYHGKPFASGAQHKPCDKFVAPDPKPVTDLKELVHVVGDVPHESHSFTDEQLAALLKQGTSVSEAYPGKNIPGGRWRELTSSELQDSADQARENENFARAAQFKRKAEAEQKKAQEAENSKQAESDAAKQREAAIANEIDKEARIRHRLEQLKSQPGDADKPQEPAKTEPPKGDGSGTVQ